MDNSQLITGDIIPENITRGLILERTDAGAKTNIPHLVTHHSLTGYEFGYGGSGPADLALNVLEILLNRLGHTGARVQCYRGTCWAKAWALHQDFKWEFIAPAPREGCVIPYEDMIRWVQARIED